MLRRKVRGAGIKGAVGGALCRGHSSGAVELPDNNASSFGSLARDAVCTVHHICMYICTDTTPSATLSGRTRMLSGESNVGGARVPQKHKGKTWKLARESVISQD